MTRHGKEKAVRMLRSGKDMGGFSTRACRSKRVSMDSQRDWMFTPPAITPFSTPCFRPGTARPASGPPRVSQIRTDGRAGRRILIQLMGKSLAYDTLFTTDTGYLGRAESTVNAVEQGDILCIIHGCRIPAILRSQGDRYKLLTFAYVADVMEGQYFDDHAPGENAITLC